MKALSNYDLYETILMYWQLIAVAKNYSHIQTQAKELARLEKESNKLLSEYHRREQEPLTK